MLFDFLSCDSHKFPFCVEDKRTSSFVPSLRTTTYYKMDSVRLIYQCNYYPFLPFLRKVAVVASYVRLQQQYLQVGEAPLLMSAVFVAYLRLFFNAMLLNQYDYMLPSHIKHFWSSGPIYSSTLSSKWWNGTGSSGLLFLFLRPWQVCS